MLEVIKTLLVSCIPAIFTGLLSYLNASKKAKSEMLTLKESNKHDIEKLMQQHRIDIESLKEKHMLEMELSEQEHKHNIEIMEIQHRNSLESKEKEQSSAAMYNVMADLLKNPEKLDGFINLASNPIFNNNKKDV